jgi:hypothetical protein
VQESERRVIGAGWINWANFGIAVAALAVSAWTATTNHIRRYREIRHAEVTVYFTWLTKAATVRPAAGGDEHRAWYHVVICNRGPAIAQQVDLKVLDSRGKEVVFVDSPKGEFPLKRLDAGARYPIPWALGDGSQEKARRFEAKVSWTDGNGRQTRELPLRRGQIML